VRLDGGFAASDSLEAQRCDYVVAMANKPSQRTPHHSSITDATCVDEWHGLSRGFPMNDAPRYTLLVMLDEPQAGSIDRKGHRAMECWWAT
jgi:hypothetical protein